MSEQPMSSMPLIAQGGAAGFFGKMPLMGDFVSRRVSNQVISIWDNWLRHGLFETKNAQPTRSFADQFHTTPVWNFVVPRAVLGEPMIGLIGASCDRVGRQFPFSVLQSLDSQAGSNFRLDHIIPFFLGHGPIMRALQQRQLGFDQLEDALRIASDWQVAVAPFDNATSGGDILSILNDPGADLETTVEPPLGGMLPWPGLALKEIMMNETSYWWTNQAAGGPLRAFTHNGGLNERLFTTLFSPLAR